MTSIIEEIVAENLAVYRASPSRVREDASQESQIANDYRGRLLYELLQNADDAMVDGLGNDKIYFRLTDTDLWVGNSGRPLTDTDVRGLCGIGASSKTGGTGKRRASIGHKGMGFKSVLEITDRPRIYSETVSFELSPASATPLIREALDGGPVPQRIPIMRLPQAIDAEEPEWTRLSSAGYRTLFRFPLKNELDAERRALLIQRLLELPPTAILFLKHLELVEIDVATPDQSTSRSWRLTRTRLGENGELVHGLSESGVYHVELRTDDGETAFVVAHDAEVEIGQHRGGLSEEGWAGVELTEISVAAAVAGTQPTPIPEELRRFHVFLPTAEVCPYPLLVNGAFMTDLSRQEVRIGDESDDYNRFLMTHAARLVRERLLQALEERGASWREVVGLFARPGAPDAPPGGRAGDALWRAVADEVGQYPLLPLADGAMAPPARVVVPPVLDRDDIGAQLRELMPSEKLIGDRGVPCADACTSSIARIAADLGAETIDPLDVPAHLSAGDLSRIELRSHESLAVSVDPVLEVLQAIWESLGLSDREAFAAEVRKHPLFPVGRSDVGVERVRTEGLECFYPPRSLKGTVPLKKLVFLLQDICWGGLGPRERQEVLHDELVSWQGLFQIREFKFPDVMRASVLPSLALDAPPDPGLELYETLAAICQLSGRAPNPRQPLRYERLGSNRALFNLCRLKVPCRTLDGEDAGWHPAYRAYFGEDWIGADSLECVLRAITEIGQAAPPDVVFLQPYDRFEGLLSRFDHLHDAALAEEADSDEVELEEDEEDAYDTGKEMEHWLVFLEWLGVNRALRLVHFHDAEDQKTWLSTKELSRPEGWAFANVATELWTSFVAQVRSALSREGVPYFTQLHDFDQAAAVLNAAAEESCTVARALYSHLELNWGILSRLKSAEVAVVKAGVVPSMRKKPPRPRDDELVDAGDNLWLTRLRHAQWCPTSHGPKRPSQSWLRTPEVDRRFGRQGSNPAQLLPLLDLSGSSPDRGFATTLGVRTELTPASFGPSDAAGLLNRLELVFGSKADHGELEERDLRTVVRPAYRNLIELLPGREEGLGGDWSEGILAGAPLLTHDGNGGYRFAPSNDVFHIDRAGTRERLGSPEDLWTFVLEGARGARGPLTTLLRVHILEESIDWTPIPGDDALGGELEIFRQGLRELEPFIAARLAADRQEESLVALDRRRLSAFVSTVLPVTSLEVRCRVGNTDLGIIDSRGAFVDVSGSWTAAFVIWDEAAWPPTPECAESLATALADLLQPGFFEAFLALITASSDHARLKLLRLAGAPLPHDLGEIVGEEPIDPVSDGEVLRTAGETTTEQAPTPPVHSPKPIVPKTPLYRPDQLLIESDPVMVAGAAPRESKASGSSKVGDGGSNGNVYGGRTDLAELDRVGMAVAMAFERRRLGDGAGDDFVFDVSTKEAIEAARQHSARFRSALEWLGAKRLNPLAPGFDILTLDPTNNEPQRLIELKSSGIHARTQEMSWNEWKTASDSALREKYYLYLVGNLRSDLGSVRPFLRAVRDPFGSILSEEKVGTAETRSIRLDTQAFTAAEQVTLTVRESPSSGQPVAN